MRKIPTVFLRDRSSGFVTDVVTPGCEWVLAGEGTPTVKFDGTCVMFDGSSWWARREVKPGRDVPEGFVEVEADPVTGKRVGWVPIESSPFVKFWREAFQYPPMFQAEYVPGTYELCGPKINRNPEGYPMHRLVRHGVMPTVKGDPVELIAACRRAGSEGVVWHHPDGRMAKLKVRDYPKPGMCAVCAGVSVGMPALDFVARRAPSGVRVVDMECELLDADPDEGIDDVSGGRA